MSVDAVNSHSLVSIPEAAASSKKPSSLVDRIGDFVKRLLSSPVFLAVVGVAIIVVSAVVLASSPISLIALPLLIPAMVLGASLLLPALMDRKRVVYEITLLAVVLHNSLFGGAWSNEIIPDKLTLGAIPLKNMGHLESIASRGITSVLSLLESFEWLTKTIFSDPAEHEDWVECNVQHKAIEAVDYLPMSLEKIDEGVEYLKLEIIDKDGHAYVHCKAGMGRSAMIVIAYLLKYGHIHGLHLATVSEAIAFVTAKRSVVLLSDEQKAQLELYHSSYCIA